MKRAFLLAVAALFCITAFSQTRKELYDSLAKSFKDKDTVQREKIIADWERLYPKDAELYSVYANLYLSKAMKEVVIMSKEKPEGEEYFTGKDSLGNEIYMYSTVDYDGGMLQKSLSTLEEGISKFPDRLDFRFGLASVLYDTDNYREMVNVLCKTVERSRENGNNWLWTLDEKTDDGEGVMLDSFQDYFNDLFNELGEKEHAETLVNKVLQYYPNSIVFLNDKAIFAYDRGDLDGALKEFLNIHSMAPDDAVVINNIAYLYQSKNDKANALKYYRLLEKTGDEYYAPLAKKAIAELEK
ncbi:MAG: hypothetical protein IK103_05185 [Bacteroidales bacterium]|nr:hypothetical protein [Bacteroidales bacterium]MBR6466266.1 hypothetical protein [Bacteroidales bacterium]